MNAGGVLNTCKSNEFLTNCDFGQEKLEVSGGRVSNAWVTCLTQGDNDWKRSLIPHKTTVPHGTGVKEHRCKMDPRLIRQLAG